MLQIHHSPQTRVVSVPPAKAPAFALDCSDTAETLEFLRTRGVHNIVMTGLIQDNGIDHPMNRGRFIGYRASTGALEGVALAGHLTLVEARSDEALSALAREARSAANSVRLIMSAGDVARSFWHYLDPEDRDPSRICRELLFETSTPLPTHLPRFEVLRATADYARAIAVANAEIAVMDSGRDPMEIDPVGFISRTTRRIEQGRVFGVFDRGRVIFKADVIAETPAGAYIEGVYVAEELRGRGIGSNCLATLTNMLLMRVPRVCLLSNTQTRLAHRAFVRAGYRNTDACTTLFV